MKVTRSSTQPSSGRGGAAAGRVDRQIQFITGVRDVANDADRQAFEDALVANGSEQYVQIHQEAWDAST